MNLSGHSLVTTFDAPPVSGGALASVFHLQIDRTHAATLRAVQSEGCQRTVCVCLTVFEREIAPELSRFAASVLAQTREIEDLRGDRYAGNESRSELYWRDTHARDGYPRALLVRDRETGQLFQAPNTIGESEHFEVVGFAVLEKGAPRFARLGDARAYFSAPEFAEKVAARLARKQQQELRGGLRPVQRNARVVSMPDNADEIGQPDAIVRDLTPAERDWLSGVLADAEELASDGATDAELREALSRAFAKQKPDLDAERMGMAIDLALGLLRIAPPPVVTSHADDYRPAARVRPVSDETLEFVRLWTCAVMLSNYGDSLLEPLSTSRPSLEFSPREYAAQCGLASTPPAGRIAFTIENAR